MNKKIGRYSHLIRFIVIGIDFVAIFLCSICLLKFDLTSYVHLYLLGSWFAIANYTGFYKVYRYTGIVTIIQNFFKQCCIYFICFYAFLGLTAIKLDKWEIIVFFTVMSVILFVFKFLVFTVLKEYRLNFGGNKRHVIVLGNSRASKELVNFFKYNAEYGYYLQKVFEPCEFSKQINMKELDLYIQNNGIDEIYCSLKSIDSDQISTLFTLANNNFKTIKFIPDNHELLLRKMELHYYGILPLMTINQTPLDELSNSVVKRFFDLVFALLIIVFFLIWMIPIIAICIRIDSKGPIFFKQRRNGLNYKEFNCYKFRSLYFDDKKDEYKPISKKDRRVTRVGRFLRQTSMDELPQFFNVLIGNMSVVGPRPHALIYNQVYTRNVENFKIRHIIKPGITGMAQTHGYRGEVENRRDIVNRVKYDIFYIENWSLLLDLKIIFNTVIKAFKGDKKAY